jgi:hypothetical protein
MRELMTVILCAAPVMAILAGLEDRGDKAAPHNWGPLAKFRAYAFEQLPVPPAPQNWADLFTLLAMMFIQQLLIAIMWNGIPVAVNATTPATACYFLLPPIFATGSCAVLAFSTLTRTKTCTWGWCGVVTLAIYLSKTVLF